MEPIRLLTIGLPNLLEGVILNAFGKRGSVNTIGHYENLQQFIGHSADIDPTIIIIESANIDDCLDVLNLYPKINLVYIEHSGKSFNLWKLVPRKQVLGEVSADELVEKILSGR